MKASVNQSAFYQIKNFLLFTFGWHGRKLLIINLIIFKIRGIIQIIQMRMFEKQKIKNQLKETAQFVLNSIYHAARMQLVNADK